MKFAFLLLALCGAADAYVLGAATPRGALTTFRGAIATPQVAAPTPRTPAVLLQESNSLNPIALGTVGVGSLGIFFAAYCTSTGSPPTGLLVAVLSLGLMYAGAGASESSD